MIQLQQYAVRFSLLIVFGMAMMGVGWELHTWKIAKVQFQLELDKSALTAENDQLKTKLGAQHGKEDELNNRLADAARAKRVRLPKGCIKPNTASGSTNEDPGNGGAPRTSQEALDRFKRGVDELAKDADDMAASCRVVVEWARKQGGLP